MTDPYYPKLTLHYQIDGPSVFGEPDSATVELLEMIQNGKILDVGAGDGRYTISMLKENTVVAGDVDQEPLSILQKKVPENLRAKLSTKLFNAFEQFPFPPNSFNAVVCTAFLYLYPKSMIRTFLKHAHTVLKPDGAVIFDFVTERQRRKPNGELIEGKSEVAYSLEEGKQLIEEVLDGFFEVVKMNYSIVSQDLTKTAGYTMSAKKLSVLAKKISIKFK